MSATDYVYRLRVVYPEGVNEDNPPEGWEPFQYRESDTGAWADSRFHWPAHRRCLAASTARRWAEQLRSWGCQVTIERSLPVQWPAPTEEEKAHRLVILERLASGDETGIVRWGGGTPLPPYRCGSFPDCRVGSYDPDIRDAHEYLSSHGAFARKADDPGEQA